jgi:hypothetical protein
MLDAELQFTEDADGIRQWFQQLCRVIEEYDIQPSEIYNIDETGFRIGVSKTSLVVTRGRRYQYLDIKQNRESATPITCISAAEFVLPTFLILTS